MSSLRARAPDWRRPRRRPRYCCRSAAVVCPYARRQNAAPLGETAGDCKSHWWTLLYTTWFSCRLECSISFLVDGCSTPLRRPATSSDVFWFLLSISIRLRLRLLCSAVLCLIWRSVFRSRVVHPWDMVPRCQVSRCPVPRFQRPSENCVW